MSYSSQRYDLDAAAARKRNSVCSNHGAYSDYDRRRNSRSSSSRTSDSYSRRSGEFEMPYHMRWEQQHHHPRRDQNLRPRRGSASCPVLDDYSHLNRERRASNDRRRPRSDRGRDRSPQEEINTMLNSGRAPKIKRGSTYGTYIMPLDMRGQYQTSDPTKFNPRASCDRIVAFLAPDKRYAKVLVHWNNGTVQKLDSNVPMGDLLEYAEYLEIREVKQVRWVA
uniref:Uncharacterized protein n=1 Tax=Fusarium oxysporum (strain Fo5176) TaxID=660025 RepID=A0A0D2Y437_FUSOF